MITRNAQPTKSLLKNKLGVFLQAKNQSFANLAPPINRQNIHYFLKISHQTKSTHSLISSFQICPGRQNFEGSPP
ncbi:MAG: hypothetical protein VW497_08090, partial [Paracoccaceae bacterium]